MGGIEESLSLEERKRITEELLSKPDPLTAALPKVELHVHIEGTLTPELRWKLAQRNNLTLKLERTGATYTSLEQLAASYELLEKREGAASFDNDEERFTFFEAYYGGFEVLLTEEDFHDLAMDYFERAAALNVRYAEPFFDPQGHTRRGVKWETMMGGFRRAQVEAEQKFGVSCPKIPLISTFDLIEWMNS
jgi:adenosine deaminase